MRIVSKYDTVRSRKVDQLKDTFRPVCRWVGKHGTVYTCFVHRNKLARLDIAQVLGAGLCHCAGFAGKYVPIAQPANRERPEPVWIAGCHDAILGHNQERKCPAQLSQGPGHALWATTVHGVRQYVDQHLAVRAGLENRARILIHPTELVRIREVAVVSQRPDTIHALDDKGLNVVDTSGTRRRIAYMPNPPVPVLREDRWIRKNLADQALAFVRAYVSTIADDNTTPLLATMLKREEAAIDQSGSLLRAEDTEDAALLPGAVKL